MPFTKHVVDLSNDVERAALLKLWPMGKFPVLSDATRGVTVAESSIILEYVEQRCSARGRLIPFDDDAARECRLRDRFFDLYVNMPMGKIVTDELRPESRRDPYGVEQAEAQLESAYAIADDWMRQGPCPGRHVHHGRLCRGAGALLRKPGRSLRRRTPTSFRLFRASV